MPIANIHTRVTANHFDLRLPRLLDFWASQPAEIQYPCREAYNQYAAFLNLSSSYSLFSGFIV
jgi:hypothetical protein